MFNNVKVHYGKPMSAGDSTLMMLLALNLLLLVFFMMLNSMATYGAKHAEDVLSQVRSGYNVPAPSGMNGTENVPEVPFAIWRSAMMSRMQGLVLNRIDLRVLPQEGSAGKVEIELPMSALFDSNFKLVNKELVGNMAAAAGAESSVIWQVKGRWESPEPMAKYAAALAAVAGKVQAVSGGEEGLRVVITPGVATKSVMGLQVQSVGENAGGGVKGLDIEKVQP